MKAIVSIDLNDPQALPLLNYLESLPFAKIESKKSAPPCRYTQEEVRQRIDLAVNDIRQGKSFSTEEVFKPYEKWL
jgi:hypothetical protein